jgi:hypothetical protein
MALNNRGCHTSFFLFSENGEWGHGTLSLNGGGSILGDWRMENEEWRKHLVEGFTMFHMGLLLSPGIHTTKSAWWMRQWTSNPSVWLEHKFLPHVGCNGNSHSHSAFSILHSPFFTDHKRVSHLSPWRSYLIDSSFFSFNHSSFSLSPWRSYLIGSSFSSFSILPFSIIPFSEEVWHP